MTQPGYWPDSPSKGLIANKGRYECPLCEARFDTVGEKKRHMKEEHRGS